MQDYIIMTDSTVDLPDSLIKSLEIEVLPLHFNINGQVYGDYADGRDMNQKEFYRLIRSGNMSTTSQINPEDFIKAFEPHLKSGTDILYIAFSSGLSGTFDSARIAGTELSEAYPDRKIRIVDSLCASMGEGLLVYRAVMEKRNGLSVDDLEKWINQKKLNICHWFTVDDLNHLKRGGRISSAVAFLGGMLNIKPVLHVDNDGRLVLVGKARGRQRSIKTLLSHMEKTGTDISNQTVFISHGDCEDEAEEMKKEIKKRFGVREVILGVIGPVIGSHSGPGTIALFFEGSQR